MISGRVPTIVVTLSFFINFFITNSPSIPLLRREGGIDSALNHRNKSVFAPEAHLVVKTELTLSPLPAKEGGIVNLGRDGGLVPLSSSAL